MNHPNRNWRKKWRIQPCSDEISEVNWAAAIKNYRIFRELTQIELAKRLDVDLRTISYWESGDIKPPSYLLLALSVLE